jgi:hypothetical protein
LYLVTFLGFKFSITIAASCNLENYKERGRGKNGPASLFDFSSGEEIRKE